jgi:hypothetical protein
VFKAIRQYNNWGSIEYRVGGKDSDGQDITDKLRTLKTVRVLFPDGTDKRLPLVQEFHSEEVSDMGHHYTVNSKKFFVTHSLFGIETRIPIENLKVDLS